MAKTVRGKFHPQLIRGDKRQGDSDTLLMFDPSAGTTVGHGLVIGPNGDAVDGGAGGGATLETNGVANGSQSILNLKQGTGITIADDGVGGITITGPTIPTNVVDVVFAYPGAPPNLATIQLVAFNRTTNFLANFGGSHGHCGANPSATATLTLQKNGVTCGTISINTSGSFSFTSSGGAAVTFSAGDTLAVITPATDATLSSVTFNLSGTR
jgi:VCBS repeat-containing protein